MLVDSATVGGGDAGQPSSTGAGGSLHLMMTMMMTGCHYGLGGTVLQLLLVSWSGKTVERPHRWCQMLRLVPLHLLKKSGNLGCFFVLVVHLLGSCLMSILDFDSLCFVG